MAEKKFCTNCGKQLKKGETCDCKKESTSKTTSTDFAGIAKGLWEDLVNMFKKPATTVKEKVKEANVTTSLIVLGLISISIGIFAMAFAKLSIGAVLNTFIKEVEIPYFKMFVYGALITFGGSFIPILVSFGTAKVVKEDKFDFKKSLALYAYSYYPLTVAFLAFSVIILANINLLTDICIVAFSILAIATCVTYIKAYLEEVEIKADRVAYTIAIMLVVIGLVSGFASKYIATSTAKDITSSVSTKSTSGLSSLLK